MRVKELKSLLDTYDDEVEIRVFTFRSDPLDRDDIEFLVDSNELVIFAD